MKDQVLIRSGLCLSCSGTWTYLEGRIQCCSSCLYLNKCPKGSCKYFTRLEPGQQPPEILIIGPLVIEPAGPSGDFVQIGDIEKWILDGPGRPAGCAASGGDTIIREASSFANRNAI